MAVAVALKSFEKSQWGRESTKGTTVPATRVRVFDGMLAEKREHYYSEKPRGYRTTVGGDGILLRQWTEFEAEGELTPQEILWPLLCGIKGNITATGTSPKIWTFSPELTSEPTLDTATIEFMESDGSTNHIASEVGYAMCSKVGLDLDAAGEIKLKESWFARARQTTTPTAALTAYTNRDAAILVPQLVSWYSDSSWAGLGGTQLAGIVRKASWECETGNAPDWTMDARSDQDQATHKYGKLKATLGISYELNSVSAAKIANWRARTREFIRMKCLGPTLGSGNYMVQIDGSYRCEEPPTFETDDEYELVTFKYNAVLDATASKVFEIVVHCDLSAVASL